MGQAHPSSQPTICGACGSGVEPAVLVDSQILSCGFIASHELQQNQYLMAHFFGAWYRWRVFTPLAGMKHKLVADEEKVDGESP